MIVHVVLFRLKERNPGNILKAKEVLKSLQGRVPGLLMLEVGSDVVCSERSYDIALIARFDTIKDLEAYQAHPYHVEVANYMAAVRESAIAVDYEQ